VPVFIVGGPSNVGKTTAASAIAEQMGCAVLAVDDLARRSTASALAFERDPATWTRPPPELVRLLINKGEALWPEVRTATTETLASRGTLVIEGEGPAPAAMATFSADDFDQRSSSNSMGRS
jgi:cytidylate kinase